jgi:hypothetical protein
MEAKYARRKDESPAVFVDPDGYAKFVADKEREFRATLARQRAAP